MQMSKKKKLALVFSLLVLVVLQNGFALGPDKTVTINIDGGSENHATDIGTVLVHLAKMRIWVFAKDLQNDSDGAVHSFDVTKKDFYSAYDEEKTLGTAAEARAYANTYVHDPVGVAVRFFDNSGGVSPYELPSISIKKYSAGGSYSVIAMSRDSSKGIILGKGEYLELIVDTGLFDHQYHSDSNNNCDSNTYGGYFCRVTLSYFYSPSGPSAPSGMSSTGSYAGNSVSLSWNKPASGAVTFPSSGTNLSTATIGGLRAVNRYEVFYKRSGGTYSHLGYSQTESGVFNISGLSDGSYQFSVKAYDIFGNSSGLSMAVNVTKDTTPPGAPAGLKISADSAVKSASGNSFYVRGTDTDIRFQWQASSGAPASYSYVCGSITGTTTGCSVAAADLSEGSKTYSVSARDAAGNNSGTSSLTVNVDDSAPPAPSGLSSSGIQDLNQADRYYVKDTGCFLSWQSPLSEGESQNSWQSGLDHFLIVNAADPAAGPLQKIPAGTAAVYSSELTLPNALSADTKKIDVKVILKDKVGNASESSAITVIRDNSVIKPDIGAASLTLKTHTLNWLPVADPSGISGYRLSLSGPLSGSIPELHINAAGYRIDPVNGEIHSDVCLLDGGTFQVPVGLFETAAGLTNAVKTGVVYTASLVAIDRLSNESDPATRSFTLDNISPDICVGSETVSLTLPGEGGVFHDAGIPLFGFSATTDPTDGDLLRYRLRICKGTQNYVSDYVSAGTALNAFVLNNSDPQGPVPGSFTDGNYSYYIEVQEYIPGFKSLNPLRYPDAQTGLRTLTIDSTDPSVSALSVTKAADQLSVYTSLSTAAVSVAGVSNAGSGVCEVDIRNTKKPFSGQQIVEVKMGPSSIPAGTAAIDLRSVLSGTDYNALKSGVPLLLSLSRDQALFPENLSLVNWPLPDEQGEHVFTAGIRDRAGNDTNRSAVIIRDTSAPAEPVIAGHEHLPDGRIRITWPAGSDTDIDSYRAAYSVGPVHGSLSVYADAGESMYSVNLPVDPERDGVAWNSSLSVALTATDKAENSTAGPDYHGAYTRAKIAVIEAPCASDREGSDMLTLRVRNSQDLSGKAVSQRIDLYSGDTDTVVRTCTVSSPAAAFVFSGINGISPHGVYSYRITATNPEGKEFSSEKRNLVSGGGELPNIAASVGDFSSLIGTEAGGKRFSKPTMPVPLGGFALQDEEQDPLAYAIIFRGAGFSETKRVPIELSGADVLAIDLESALLCGGSIADGDLIDWHIEVSDGRETVVSPVFQFIIDEFAPVFSYSPFPFPPGTSGVTKLSALTLGGVDDIPPGKAADFPVSGPEESCRYAITPLDGGTARTGLQSVTTELTLPHGRYGLSLSLSDKAGNRNELPPLGELLIDYISPEVLPGSEALELSRQAGARYLRKKSLPVRLIARDPGTSADVDVVNAYASGLRGVRYWFVDSAGKSSAVCT